MDANRYVGGPYEERPPGTGEERPSKRGKTEEVAHQIFEENEEALSATPQSPTLKRARGEEEEAGPGARETSQKKTKDLKEKILPCKSCFPQETAPLVRDVDDVSLQNEIKKAGDNFFTRVNDRALREEVVNLVLELPSNQRVPFLERTCMYIECSPQSLKFLAKIPPEDRVNVMDGLKIFFPFPSGQNNDAFDRLSKQMPIDRLLDRLGLINFFFPGEISDSHFRWYLLAHFNKLPIDLCNTLKPELQGISDVITGGVFHYILPDFGGKERQIDPSHLAELISETKPLLHSALKFTSRFDTLTCTILLGIIAKVSPQKRKAAIELATHLLKSEGQSGYWHAMFHPDFSFEATTQHVDNGIAQTRRFFNEYGKALGMSYSEFAAQLIFPIFANNPSNQFDDIVKRAIPYFNGMKGEFQFIIKVLECITKTPPILRDKIQKQVDSLANFIPSEYRNPQDKLKLYQALLQIPEEQQRDSVITYARELLDDVECNGKDIADLLRAIHNIDPGQRELVIEATLANLDEETTIDEIIDDIDYYNSYTLEIAQEDIQERPLELLTQVGAQIESKSANRIKVTFKGEVGQDAGGLGRVFISELFDALKIALAFQVRESTGLCSPIATDLLSDETKKAYNNIGQVLMFCLNATTDYPIGMIFEQSVFTALTKLQEKYFDRPIQKLIQDEKVYKELCTLYIEMNRLDEFRHGTLEWLKNNRDDPEAREMIQGMLVCTFEPLIEIARGMKAAPFKKVTFESVQKISPLILSEKLQGKVDEQTIVAALEFDASIPENLKQGFIAWIKNADDAKRVQFLLAMTGSPALGSKPLEIKACEGGKVIFHTCFNSVELPVQHLDSPEKLNFTLDNILGGGKFTIA